MYYLDDEAFGNFPFYKRCFRAKHNGLEIGNIIEDTEVDVLAKLQENC